MDSQVMTLANSLDLIEAADLKAELESIGFVPLQLDASGTRFLGTHCLQILIAAATAWDALDVPFHLVRPTAEFTEGLNRLGFTTLGPNAQEIIS